MVIPGADGKPMVTPRPKNPGVPRMDFKRLVERVEALEARVVELEGGPTVKELAAELKELGVSAPRGASKAMMVELLAKAKQE